MSAASVDTVARLPDFVRSRLTPIREACRRYRVERLYLYGSAVTDAYKPGESDLDFMVEFTPEARDHYDGPVEHYFRGIPITGRGAAYPVNYRALSSALADIFADCLTEAEGRSPIDIGTYSCIDNEYFKQAVDSHKVELYARA